MARIDITNLLLEALSVEEISRSPIRVSLVVQIITKLASKMKMVCWGGKLRELAWNQVHYPTTTLAERAGADRKTVIRHLNFLEQIGLIATESSTRDGTIITLTMLSATIDAPNHDPIDGTNHGTISGTNDGAALRPNPPLEIPLSNVAQKKGNIIIAGGREAATKAQIDECWEVYCTSLEHLGIPRKKKSPTNESSLLRAINHHGFDDVRDALEGVRYEVEGKSTKPGSFDPIKHVSIEYCIHKNQRGHSNLERLGNVARMKRKNQLDQEAFIS